MSGFGPNSQYHAKVPPLKGAFPLDHDGECKQVVSHYLACLKQFQSQQEPCRSLAKEYLDCRMRHGLMAPEEWSKLGFKDLDNHTLNSQNQQ